MNIKLYNLRPGAILHLLLALSVIVCISLPAGAQEGLVTVSGRVIDRNGDPLAGVSLAEKGTIRGTSTAVDGYFRLTAAPGGTVSVFYLGYAPREIPVSELDGAVITLDEEARAIDDVVVVGYAVQKKVNLTGAVSALNMGDVTSGRPVTNLSSALSGLSPGLYVNQNTGRPNSDGATLMVRGRGTLNDSSPLVIIDGVEGSLGDVNAHDVESITVLKDASSSAIYGSRAANGVILVTTRQGREGRFTLSYNGYASVTRPPNVIKTVNNYADYMEYYNEALYNTDRSAKQQYSDEMIKLWRDNPGNPDQYPNTDWTREIFDTGLTHNHDLSFSAGSKGMSLYGSLGYLDNPGIVENSAYKRYTARVNVSAQVTGWLKLGINVSGKNGNADMGSKYMGSMFDAIGTPGIIYRAKDGRYGGIENPEENAQTHSPLYLINNRVGTIKGNEVSSRFTAQVSILENLSLEGALNYRYANTLEEETPRYDDLWSFRTNTIVYARNGNTYVRNRNTADKRVMMDVVARYGLEIVPRLSMNLLAGASQEKYKTRWFEATRYDLLEDRLGVINAATGDSATSGTASDWVMHSYFGRVNLAWDDKYLFEANVRADGSSRFAAGSGRWGIFPSFSVGWRMEQEEFLRSHGWLDILKIRASWGSLGNNSVGNYEYQSVYSQSNYILGNSLAEGVARLALANSALTWETTYVTNAGGDFGFFRSRLSGTVDVFDKDTRNILIELPAPLLVGTVSIPTQNSARVRNRGLELSLRWQDTVGEFAYWVGGNVSHVRNKVMKFKGDEANISGTSMIKEGYPINVQYVLAVDRIIQTQDDMMLVQQIIKNAPVDPETGLQKNPFAAFGTPTYGDFLYKDLNSDGIIDENDRYTVGNGNTPLLTYGIQLGGEFRNFDLSVLLQGTQGMKVLWNDNFHMGYINYGGVINRAVAEGAWREGMTDARYPRLLTSTNKINNQPSDFWVENKSYMRLKNIQ
ncbi:MAG: TonB-dependent receptor [Alistipes sp.]|nr:TonB-dependent receptor [Alistipes sp.]